nr:hypothetical protein [Tanacetum cinerariifolium]
MPVQQGECSGTPTEPHHTPSREAQSPSHTTHTSPTLPPVTTSSIPTVIPSDTPIAQEVEINRLKERVKLLEDREGVAATRSGDDAPIKGMTTVLASGVVDVPTGSGSIPTASTPAEEQVPTGSVMVPTGSPVFSTATVVTPYRKRKGKEVMVESETPKKQRVQEQIDA